ncbi:kumamolisin [Nakamurella sp. UYEF19]|uniref:S53 family peptidase n=1 Tax=Nakamurella sp. UYEF19 TaxID=1756392 RepID=UPI003392C721
MSNDAAHEAPEAIERRTVPGSHRAPVPGSEKVGELAGDTRIQVTLVLRRRAELPDDLPGPISKAELAEKYGADPADVTAVTSAVEAAGAQVVSADAASRLVVVSGSATVLEGLFGTELAVAKASDAVTGRPVEYRARVGELTVPAGLSDIVTAVLGLDNRPQARTRVVAAAAATAVSYSPLDLGKVYRFPAGTDGTGQTIAIIELGGGFGQSDLDTYFGGLGITGPAVTAVGVDGAENKPGQDPSGADGEVLLDIEVVGALAPGSQILVYFAPNTDAGFLDAVSQAAHAEPAPASISISWGQSEDDWTAQARKAMDSAFADAAALGVTVTAAAGDDGSTDRATDNKAHCDFPASSPHALACGGTSLRADPSAGTVTSETVWDNGIGNGATGGGVSSKFKLPSWQKNAGVPARSTGSHGRGVPDVAGDADPQTGYQVLIDGKPSVIGGTSAVAPLWAALTARLVQALGRPLGLLQPALYAGVAAGAVQPGFRDITVGNNGQYQAGAGWDACTGLGVPDGEALLTVLGGGGR